VQLKTPLLLAILIAGCGKQTGIELAVGAPASPSSVQMGVATLEFVVAHQSWCERWVADQSASGTSVDVTTRDLAKSPYRLLVQPTHLTDLSQPVFSVAIARDASGHAIGLASFGDHPFRQGSVDQYAATLNFFRRQDASYVADDGCVCAPGQPWIGTGSGTGCDPGVVTSFARLQDTATCELAPGLRELTAPVCDGHPYLDETQDRQLPCFHTGESGCQLSVRNCADHDGIAYDEECTSGSSKPLLPSAALCSAYAACEQTACGDLIGCFLAAVPATRQITCTLRVDPASANPVAPCPSGTWEAPLFPASAGLTGAACVSSVIEGVVQHQLTLGLKSADPNATGAQPASTLCPPTLLVDKIAIDTPAQVPDQIALILTVGDGVVNVTINVVRACGTEPSLVCAG
jgi:hypothetical protein